MKFADPISKVFSIEPSSLLIHRFEIPRREILQIDWNWSLKLSNPGEPKILHWIRSIMMWRVSLIRRWCWFNSSSSRLAWINRIACPIKANSLSVWSKESIKFSTARCEISNSCRFSSLERIRSKFSRQLSILVANVWRSLNLATCKRFSSFSDRIVWFKSR